MRTKVRIRQDPDEQDLREMFYLKKALAFGRNYKEFDRSSVEMVLNILRAYDRIWGHFSKRMQPYGLSPGVFNLLMILRQSKGEKLTQHEISKLLLVSRANVTGLVNNLVRKGLAKRMSDKSDRRAWLIRITAKGEALLDRYLPRHYGEVRRIFSDFSASEKRRANDLFYKFKDGLQKCSS